MYDTQTLMMSPRHHYITTGTLRRTTTGTMLNQLTTRK